MPVVRSLPATGSRNSFRQQGLPRMISGARSDPIPTSSARLSRSPQDRSYDTTSTSSSVNSMRPLSLSEPVVARQNWPRANPEALVPGPHTAYSGSVYEHGGSDADAESLAMSPGISSRNPRRPASRSAAGAYGSVSAGPTPASQESQESQESQQIQENQEDVVDPMIFMWDDEDEEPIPPAPIFPLFSAEGAFEPPFSRQAGNGLGRSVTSWLFAPPAAATTNPLTASGVFTLPYHPTPAPALSVAAVAANDGQYVIADGSTSRQYAEATSENVGQSVTPVLHTQDPDLDIVFSLDQPPAYSERYEYASDFLDLAPPYMPPQEQGGPPFSPLEHAAMRTGTVVRFATYVRSLHPPFADHRHWGHFFDAMFRMLVYMTRQSRHLASFWTMIIFCCFMVANELDCPRCIFKQIWGRIMRLRGFEFEYNERTRISIVDQCRARIAGLVADELAVNRFLNVQRIRSSGYMAFGHGPAPANATSVNNHQHQHHATPQFLPQPMPNPLNFSISSEIPQLVYDLMGGLGGNRSYEDVCGVLEVEHLLIHQAPPAIPVPHIVAPPVQGDHTSTDPCEEVWA